MQTTKGTRISRSRHAAPRRRSVRITKRPAPRAPAARKAEPKPATKGRRWLWPTLGAVLGLIILWAPFAPWVSPKPTRVWRGFYTVVVRAGGPADQRFRGALARLGAGVVSEDTTTADVYDFSSTVRFRLAELSSRLDPLDPRRDPYIDRMGGYFSVRAGDADLHVAYIPACSSALRVFLSLAGTLGLPGRTGWRLVELDPAEKLVSLLSVMACAAILALGSWRRKRGSLSVAAAGALLWVPALMTGGPATLAMCLLLLFFWIPLLQARLVSAPKVDGFRRLRWPLFLYAAVGAGSLAVFSLLAGSTLGDSLQPAAPFLCSLLLLAVAPSFQAASRAWGRTRMFAPVPILRARTDHGNGKGRQRVLSLALFGIAVTVLIPLGRWGAFPAPLPLFGIREFSWDAVAGLQRRSAPDRLPDFSDLVGHEAYQQTIGFGRKWHYPVRDERVYRDEYLVDPAAGTVSARLRTLKTFDSTWLASVMSRQQPGTLEALLLSQERPVRAAVRSPARSLARELPFTALAFCALLALLCRDLRLGLLIRGNLWRLIGEARRDQVP